MGHPRANSAVSFLVYLITFVAMASSSVMAGSDNSARIEELIPSSLVVPQGNYVQQVLFGTGVQIYTCNGTAWVQKNVSADLYNFKGIKVGHHYFLAEVDSNGGQATWEADHPVTRVTGKKLVGVSQNLDAIPWLLLEATSNSGEVFFGITSFVQRLFTQDGLPPSAIGSAKVGDIFESSYTALYVFSAKSF